MWWILRRWNRERGGGAAGENRLIKDIQPRFNVRLMDDKTIRI